MHKKEMAAILRSHAGAGAAVGCVHSGLQAWYDGAAVRGEGASASPGFEGAAEVITGLNALAWCVSSMIVK